MADEFSIYELGATSRPASFYEAFPDLPSFPAAPFSKWIDQTFIEPLSAREWVCADPWHIDGRTLNDNMWFWFLSGRGWARIGHRTKKFPFQAGDLILIPQGVPHTFYREKNIDLQVITVHFYARVFGNVNLLELMGFPFRFEKGAEHSFLPMNQGLVREFALQAPGWRVAMKSQIATVLLDMVRHYGSHFKPVGRAQDTLPRLMPALEYIERHHTNPELKVDALAQQVYLSEVQFRKLFRKGMGMSPIDFIRGRRIEHACALLDQTQMTVEQVMFASGFNNMPYFCRVFKAMLKTTPAKYRKTVRM